MENTFTATELLTYANLQIAAEALYDKLDKPVGNPSNLIENGIVNLTPEYLVTEGNRHTSRFTSTQAAEFVENWTIVSHIANTASGFSGTLFKNKNGELVLSFRSTEFVEDYIRDNIATNTYEIFKTGWAWGQIADMERWFQSKRRVGNLLPTRFNEFSGSLKNCFDCIL